MISWRFKWCGVSVLLFVGPWWIADLVSPLGVLVGFLFFFSVMIGIDVFLSGEMCREQLISWSLPSLWSLRLLAPVLLGWSVIYCESLSWMLALSFLLYGFGNCYVSGCALSLVSFYCRSSVKLECREASELYIRFSNTAAIKIFVSLWCSIGSRFFCGPLPLDRIIPVPLFWSLDHDMVASVFSFCLSDCWPVDCYCGYLVSRCFSFSCLRNVGLDCSYTVWIMDLNVLRSRWVHVMKCRRSLMGSC